LLHEVDQTLALFYNGFVMMKSNRKKWHAFNALSSVDWKQDEAALAKPMSSPWLLLMSC